MTEDWIDQNISELIGDVTNIWVYPVKGFHGQRVDEVEIGDHGRLAVPVQEDPLHDRELVLTKGEERSSEKYDSTKWPDLKQIETSYNFQDSTVMMKDRCGELPTTIFDLEPRNRELENWVSEKLGQDVYINENSGIEDQLYVPGPSIVGGNTLEEMASWFGGESPERMAFRLRPNIVVGEVPAFWDDLLYPDTEIDEPVSIEVGDATLRGEQPCERCNIPTMDPYTGKEEREFARVYMQNREENYPEFTDTPVDPSYTGMALTTVAENQIGNEIREGDDVKIISRV